MVHLQEYKRRALIIAATLGVNMLLFTGLPNLLPMDEADTAIMNTQAVNFIRHKPGRDQQRERHDDKQKPPEPPRVVPRRTAHKITQPTHQQLKMDMPEFDWDIPANMAMGLAVAAPQPAKQAFSGIYGMNEVDQTPVPTLKTKPLYPYRARRLNLDGEVDVKFLVDTAGKVSRISIIRAKPKDLFNDSVLRALSSWRFAPGRVKGQPVNTWVTTTIAFRIDDL